MCPYMQFLTNYPLHASTHAIFLFMKIVCEDTNNGMKISLTKFLELRKALNAQADSKTPEVAML